MKYVLLNIEEETFKNYESEIKLLKEAALASSNKIYLQRVKDINVCWDKHIYLFDIFLNKKVIYQTWNEDEADCFFHKLKDLLLDNKYNEYLYFDTREFKYDEYIWRNK